VPSRSSQACTPSAAESSGLTRASGVESVASAC
jgi:hypothetical protein